MGTSTASAPRISAAAPFVTPSKSGTAFRNASWTSMTTSAVRLRSSFAGVMPPPWRSFAACRRPGPRPPSSGRARAAGARRQARRLELEWCGASAHALHQDAEIENPREDELRVEDGECGLQSGHAHRRLLEGHLLLLSGVRSVVGRD